MRSKKKAKDEVEIKSFSVSTATHEDYFTAKGLINISSNLTSVALGESSIPQHQKVLDSAKGHKTLSHTESSSS